MAKKYQNLYQHDLKRKNTKFVFQGSQKKDVRVPISQKGLITFGQDAHHFEAFSAPVHMQ